VRTVAPDIPIAVALDLHGNISPRMVENSTTLVGYKTYRHIDVVDTGRDAARSLLLALEGQTRPVLAYAHCGIMPNMPRMATDHGPMAELVAMARAEEARGALAVSVFGGFPLVDCPFTGMTVVAMTDGDIDGAQAICDGIHQAARDRRDAFQMAFEPLEATLRRAAALTDGPCFWWTTPTIAIRVVRRIPWT
jgi:microcystin degradation protein MlrC